MTASVEEGTTYTLLCVLAVGVVAPNLLNVCAILFYIPDNIKILGSGAGGIATATFAADTNLP